MAPKKTVTVRAYADPLQPGVTGDILISQTATKTNPIKEVDRTLQLLKREWTANADMRKLPPFVPSFTETYSFTPKQLKGGGRRKRQHGRKRIKTRKASRRRK
jgi:hypothetical protein